eukprot:4418719-Amphidinium_carterae.1
MLSKSSPHWRYDMSADARSDADYILEELKGVQLTGLEIHHDGASSTLIEPARQIHALRKDSD